MAEKFLEVTNRELVLSRPTWGSRGRNGYFTATSVNIYAASADTIEPAVKLKAHSRRAGKTPPAVLALSLEDAVLLAEEILIAVRAVTDPTGEITSDPEHRLKAITDVLKDENGEWRELESCADAIQEISLILDEPLQRPPASNGARPHAAD